MEVIYILVEPFVPENIGAAARAIKTMGFSELRLVNPTNPFDEKAHWLAHGSVEVLLNAKIFQTLKEATNDLDFLIGTTAKNRSVKCDYFSPEMAKKTITQKEKNIQKLGIVFGREESGLTNEELKLCDMAVTIPIKQNYPSINLSQAVMIMAYVFSDIEINSTIPENNTINYSLIKGKLVDMLIRLNIPKESNLHGRILERLAKSDSSDLKLILSIVSKAEETFH